MKTQNTNPFELANSGITEQDVRECISGITRHIEAKKKVREELAVTLIWSVFFVDYVMNRTPNRVYTRTLTTVWGSDHWDGSDAVAMMTWANVMK